MLNGGFIAIYPGMAVPLILLLRGRFLTAGAARIQATKERASSFWLGCDGYRSRDGGARLALAWRSMCPVRHLHFFARIAHAVTGGLRDVSDLQIQIASRIFHAPCSLLLLAQAHGICGIAFKCMIVRTDPGFALAQPTVLNFQTRYKFNPF